MEEFTGLLAYLLSAVGLGVLIVWPQTGPRAWMRERVFRKLLPGTCGNVLDCYICCGFWCGLILSPASLPLSPPLVLDRMFDCAGIVLARVAAKGLTGRARTMMDDQRPVLSKPQVGPAAELI